MSDLAGLKAFADELKRTPVTALDAASKALNQAAELARDRGVERIGESYNLSQSYIQGKLTVRESASRTDLFARIGSERRRVLAPRYGAAQKAVSAPGAAGDPLRGIPAGSKGAGSKPWSVAKGGNRKAWQNVFFIRTKGSNAWAMVARYGSGAGMSESQDWQQNLDVVNSVSVDQAWKGIRDDIAPEAMALASEILLLELAGGG